MSGMTLWKVIDYGPRWAAAGCYVLFAASAVDLVPNSEWGILLATFVPAAVLLFGVCVRLSAWVLKAGMWEEAGAAFMRFGLYTVLIPILIVTTFPRESHCHGASCANHMKQWGLVFKMFSNEATGGYFPELSPEPGKLMWANTSAEGNAPIYPEYLTDPSILLCPDAKDFEQQRWLENQDPRIFDDHAYLYLGYLVRDQDELEAFALAYEEQMKDTPNFRQDLTVTRTGNTLRIRRLYDGIAKTLVASATPEAVAAAEAGIPVLVERPGHHDTPGGNVLYLDGRVEFLPEGEWPYTAEAQAVLEELDAYGRMRADLALGFVGNESLSKAKQRRRLF